MSKFGPGSLLKELKRTGRYFFNRRIVLEKTADEQVTKWRDGEAIKHILNAKSKRKYHKKIA